MRKPFMTLPSTVLSGIALLASALFLMPLAASAGPPAEPSVVEFDEGSS